MESIMIMPVLLFWIGGVVLNVMIANKKRIGNVGILLVSIFLGPVLPYLYLLAVPSNLEK